MVTALLEGATGLALLLAPARIAALLLGAPLEAPAAQVMGRLAGTALLTLAVACWLARDDGRSRAAWGLVAALLLYNIAAAALLAYAGAGLGLFSVLLWPAAALHGALGAWCITALRSRPK